MDDLISRQAALDALEWKWAGKAAFDAIKALPTAEKKGEWIPVSERLPEEDGSYLVCGAKGGIYHANRRGVWWTQVGCGGKLVPTVVAWMPLPEPYKGE